MLFTSATVIGWGPRALLEIGSRSFWNALTLTPAAAELLDALRPVRVSFHYFCNACWRRFFSARHAIASIFVPVHRLVVSGRACRAEESWTSESPAPKDPEGATFSAYRYDVQFIRFRGIDLLRIAMSD